jgi:hypothetical protein
MQHFPLIMVFMDPNIPHNAPVIFFNSDYVKHKPGKIVPALFQIIGTNPYGTLRDMRVIIDIPVFKKGL